VSSPVTVVIPHFRAETLSACLESLYTHTGMPVRVIVVDDGQDAPSLQKAQAAFPQIEVLRNKSNLGFSASCNRGLEAAQGCYAVLLNDDTRVTAGWLAPLVAAAEADPGLAACQPKLLSATQPDTFDYAGGAGGYIDRWGYTFCRGRLFDHRERDEGQYDRPTPLFWACGSALFLRLSALEEVGRLDLDYFMHFEEIDLCWRLHLAGYHVLAIPASVVYHHSGWSLPPKSYRKTYLNHRNNLVALIKNLSIPRLLRLLPVRLPLEIIAPIAYMARGDWRLAPAPWAALVWCLFHPLQLRRRRRSSQACRRVPDAGLVAGVYPGSALWQYFTHGVRRADLLMPEGNDCR
jgi:GT2 family glycosyltransferase